MPYVPPPPPPPTEWDRPRDIFQFISVTTVWNFSNSVGAEQLVSIKHQGVDQSHDFNRATLDIVVARDNPLAQLFLASPPEQPVQMWVTRQYPNSSRVLWVGHIGGHRWVGSECHFKCESIGVSLKRMGLRARYSLLCRHAVYSFGCGVAAASVSVTGSVVAITGNSVQVAGAGALPAGYLIGGSLSTPAGGRAIVDQLGDLLTLIAAFPSLVVGEAVTLLPGCDHHHATCVSKFNNVVNFGGFPYMPLRNPFSGDAVV